MSANQVKAGQSLASMWEGLNGTNGAKLILIDYSCLPLHTMGHTIWTTTWHIPTNLNSNPCVCLHHHFKMQQVHFTRVATWLPAGHVSIVTRVRGGQVGEVVAPVVSGVVAEGNIEGQLFLRLSTAGLVESWHWERSVTLRSLLKRLDWGVLIYLFICFTVKKSERKEPTDHCFPIKKNWEKWANERLVYWLMLVTVTNMRSLMQQCKPITNSMRTIR